MPIRHLYLRLAASLATLAILTIACSPGVTLGTTAGSPVTTSRGFGRDTFSLSLPEAYQVQLERTTGDGIKSFIFTTEKRADGSRTLIQVILIEMDQVQPPYNPTLEEFAASMIDEVRQRRSHWKQATNTLELAGVPARRFSWSGMVPDSATARPGFEHGVMILGITGGIAFALLTQDDEPFASTTIPRNEAAMKTFMLTSHP